jgi:preprotein translocase subunit SecF
VDSVSGKVSEELGKQGGLALLAAMAAISIYIWVRFEWQFGVGALYALVHDVSLTMGMFALTQMEFDLNIVAALLTLIGYSLNDTIVIYDRIRENLKKFRRMPMPELLDLSVNETLSRTMVTSLSVLITLFALLLLGPDVIFGFTAAITLGIFVGTYSSVYMAAPILIWLKVKPDSFVPTETALERQERLAREGGASKA